MGIYYYSYTTHLSPIQYSFSLAVLLIMGCDWMMELRQIMAQMEFKSLRQTWLIILKLELN